jgi:biotin carboxylase
MSKRILVFGAGDSQSHLLKACKELGYYVVTTDPKEKALFAHLADRHVVLDPQDYEGHRQLICEEKIQGIVTCAMETPLFLMADLAQEFGFIFPSPEVVRRARSKYLMKQQFMQHGVPCAKGIKIDSFEQLQAIDFSTWTFPLIIKPVDGYSSRGVVKAENQEQLFEFYQTTKTYSSQGDVLVEEFMEGPQIGTENITYQGETTIIQTTGYIITPYPYTTELELYQPSAFSAETIEQVKEVVKRAHKAVGIDNCGSNAELIITKDGPKMVEMAARLGGDHVASHLPLLSTGVDMTKALAQIVMGEAPDLTPTKQRFSSIRYVNWEPGKRVKEVLPIQSFLQHPLVAHAAIKVEAGDVLPPVTESMNRHSFLITSGDTREALNRNVALLMDELLKYVILEN